jgi:molybdopterin-guanine dinucleotide biosynthesis protein A
MAVPVPEEVGGYVLAGGQSSRMGRDKALLELAGKPLIRHAVKKLRRVCMDVKVLGDNPKFADYAPIVPDIHPGCGPMSGMEAALISSIFDWNLFLAVDMPFLPTKFILHWLRFWLYEGPNLYWARVRMFTVDGYPQPGFCLLHKEVAPYLTAALEQGRYKLVPVLKAAALELAEQHNESPGSGFWCVPMTGFRATGRKKPSEAWTHTTEAQEAAQHLWFANLNTPEEFAEAERHVDALDT